jgi:hypothetical protein
LKIPFLVFFGMGIIGGIGCGLGYIAPVSTLVKWFPDRRGMANRHGDHGLWRGAYLAGKWLAILVNPNRSFLHDWNVRRDLLHRHDDRRYAILQRAACRMETSGLDPPR